MCVCTCKDVGVYLVCEIDTYECVLVRGWVIAGCKYRGVESTVGIRSLLS